ncbi:MAG: thioredoxin family protein [Herminiimonas sp.]|nr:thioredoxin family protein [Herminiimonas sp.]
MPAITLEPQRYAEIHALLDARTWTVCCLCAAWCDVCTAFRTQFDQLALQHPGKVMLWIDIEDRADLVDEFDVESFPTLLIQRGDEIVFLGTVEPDATGINRLILSQTREDAAPQVPATRHALQQKLAALLHAGL